MIFTQGVHLYVAEPVPDFDRREVDSYAVSVEPGQMWLEVRMSDGRVFEIHHQPPAVDIRQIEREILEARS